MPTAHDHYSQQFQKWEVRGRGWQVFPEPVSPEPPFVPFQYRKMTETLAPDDGRRPTFMSSLMRKVANTVAPKPAPEPVETEDEEEESTAFERGEIVELQASLPDRLDVSRDAFAQFLTNLSLCQEPIAFELIGSHKKVTAQFVAGTADSSLVKRQLQAFFPEAVFMPVERNLENALDAATGDDLLAVEFGLEREFMLPLASGKLDPFIGLIGALSDLGPEELGLYQIIFQPVQNPWAQNMVFAVSGTDGKPLFENTPELLHAAEAKASKPLFAAVVRIMVCADGYDRMLQLASELSGSLRVFDNLDGNTLIPLHNSEYPFVEHIEDVMKRQTRRAGMILDSDELFGFAHIPSSAVRSPAFKRQATSTKPAPGIVKLQSGLLLGTNEHMGETVDVRLSLEARVRHTHIIGASGTGKSTLLFNLIRQSIESGEGIAVLDPHGDLIDRVLGIIPEERIGDVVLVDPADEDYAIGFNILSAHSNLEKNLLASDLIAVFQRLSTSWGDQMNSVLQNAILAFLESSRGGTIADLRRFLIETPYRNEFLKTVNDSEVVYYWQKSFSHLAGNKSIGSILTRLDTFLAQKPIRHMVSQRENRLDFGHIMDSGKILLAKLPEGLLGRENSHLLGTLLVSKFQQIAMSRQAQRVESRRMFNIVIDEFANFITPSMAEILSGARKYRIGLTLAHHELHQLQRSPEVASAVMTHPYTRIVFRVGDDDARKLADGFSFFESNHLRNLETGQAICRVERSDYDFNLTVPLPEAQDEDAAPARRQEVITASRQAYSTLRSDVEAMLSASRREPGEESPPATQPSKPPQPVPPSPAPVAATPTEEPAPAAQKFTPPPPLAEILKSAQAKKPAAPAPEPKEPPPAPTPGRGGEVHQAIQKRIRDEAERLGFLSIIEKPVLDGRASIDVWLERDGLIIACEVSFTNSEDNEAEKIARCLKGGIWLRVSTEDQVKGESLETHERRAREYAAFREWNVVEVYKLGGVSGKSVMENAETKRMMADIKRGHITALIFSKLARLCRNKGELEEFAKFFRDYNADMMSLQENIDTSSPAGRLFYTMIAAMAQWEREEIVDRLNASIKTRAKMGKSLGGAAPFGYEWKDKALVVNPVEAPVRKLMYELFAEHKRRKSVARMLNEQGYRTRNGSKFTDTTVVRLLQDTTAKGVYCLNHTRRDNNGKLHNKPKEEWVFVPVEAIVSKELWKECNDALDARKADRPLGPKPVHLFAGLLHCGCNPEKPQKMYVFSRSPKYVCPECRNKIPIETIESVFHDALKEFFVSADRIKQHLESANQNLTDKRNQLAAHERQIEKVQAEMDKTYQLYQKDQITPEGFGKIYKPLEERLKQLTDELPRLQAEVDALGVRQLSAEEVLAEASDLHRRWPKFGKEEKRRIIESIVETITLTADEFDVRWSYLPSSEELTKRQRNLWGSSPPPA